MVVDVGEVKRRIKPKADSTLCNMRKADLIEYIRTLEHNYNVGATFLENQAKYIESLDILEVVRCKDCKNWKEPWLTGVELGTCKLGKTAITGPDDFCSRGERRPE